jgi:molybdenum cofactor guanylyltransferase
MDLKLGGIVLAGGQSRRMGTAKAMLPFGPETMLARVVRIVGEVAGPVVVVSANGQVLPPLGANAVVVRDSQPNCGPLEGIASGLRPLSELDAVFITGCDTPLLRPAFIRRMAAMLDRHHDAAVPLLDNLPQPLAGVYRPTVLAEVEAMLSAGERRLIELLDRIRVRRINAEELRDSDPELWSLRNLNTPADYQAALAAAGLANQNRSYNSSM